MSENAQNSIRETKSQCNTPAGFNQETEKNERKRRTRLVCGFPTTNHMIYYFCSVLATWYFYPMNQVLFWMSQGNWSGLINQLHVIIIRWKRSLLLTCHCLQRAVECCKRQIVKGNHPSGSTHLPLSFFINQIIYWGQTTVVILLAWSLINSWIELNSYFFLISISGQPQFLRLPTEERCILL